ncbi:MAG: FAD-dependent oxidoreductase, partial [Bacteroidota bacterium]|nr:FAD-dependent oxidoreductase [Bacteroidota bacterium]
LSRTLSAEKLIIATGARPRVLPGAPFDGERVLSPYDALALSSLPSSMVIIGGGAIGVEFAYFYSVLGTRVTILEMLGHLLPIEDEEISAELERSFRKRKITVKTGTRVEGIESHGAGVRVRVSGRNGEETIEADVALTAIGVRGNIEGIGLEGTPVRTRDGFITVDRAYRTDHPRVYAIGDVIGPPWLAHVASAEAVACVETMTGHREAVVDYDNIPGCTYCTPQVASVGLTEKQARERGYEVRIGKFPFTASGKAVAAGHTEGFVKLVFDAGSDRLLGAHIIGDGATELIAEAALARSLGATARDVIRTVHAHPTLSEALMEASAAAHGESVNL